MLKSLQRGDLTPAETKADYLRFAKVLLKRRKKWIQAIRRGEWRHFTITELKERKCARFTSEEKTPETIRMGK